MKKRIIVHLTIIVLLGISTFITWHTMQTRQTFSRHVIRYGAQGSDVYELQGRLKYLGFYWDKVDGDFGYNTLKSVKNFQYRFGMKVDGIVGSKTKQKLWQATKDWKPTSRPSGQSKLSTKATSPSQAQGLSSNDIKLMSNAVYGESRGEPFVGQVAVAAVILNRVKSSKFPNTISGVIFQPGAFTAVSDGQIWLTPNKKAKSAVLDALNGMDPSNGSIYYFNPNTATSGWIWSRPQVAQIGKHIFCK